MKNTTPNSQRPLSSFHIGSLISWEIFIDGRVDPAEGRKSYEALTQESTGLPYEQFLDEVRKELDRRQPKLF